MSVYTQSDPAVSVQAVDALMCAVLRGEDVRWPQGSSARFAERFLQSSDYHGVPALLHECRHKKEGCPFVVQKGLQDRALAQAMWELRHQQVLTQLLAALAKIGIQPIIFKGTALAYSLYPNPVLRGRGDTDLIIVPDRRAQAHDVLASLGFERLIGVSGDFISYQASYMLQASDGSNHVIDLHQRINNSQLLSRLFCYNELARQAVPLPDLCTNALAAGPVHALLLACMHRAVHKQSPYYVNGVAHYSGDRLIWLWDIHLLARSFTRTQWQDLVRIAKEKGLCATTLEGLDRAHAYFDTRCPEFVREALTQTGEPVALYLNASALRREWIDFRALDGLSNQLLFLRELVFPPAAYMRSKYSKARPSWLPWLYVCRSVSGIIKWLGLSRQAP